MKNGLILGWAFILLAILNGLIWQKERTVRHGQSVLLELAPRDPRSLMQGDYMVLRYVLATQAPSPPTASGTLILSLDANRVGRFVRYDQGEPLASGECRLAYRKRDGIRLGAEAYFFQEGQAALYDRARYGELRVDATGQSVLVGLRDENKQPLGSPSLP